MSYIDTVNQQIFDNADAFYMENNMDAQTTKKLTTEDEISKEIRRLSLERSKLADARIAKQRQPLIGRCFIYDNSFGDDARWPKYVKVVGLEGSNLIVNTFETDNRGVSYVSLNFKQTWRGEEFREISTELFNLSYAELLERLIAAKPEVAANA
jgi:hypothetical protein